MMYLKKFAAAFLLAMTALVFVPNSSAAFGQRVDGGSINQTNGRDDRDHDNDDNGRPRTVDPTRGLVVDDNNQCPGTDFNTIQAAVNAAGAGTLIQVCPGVYNEQVTINKRLTIVGVEYQGENQAIIKPAPATPNTTSLFSGSPIAAIVLVNQTSSVVLDNLTIDGATNGISGCATSALVGVFFRNASGSAENLAVRNVRAVGNGSCQNNFGIFAQSGNNGRSRVTVLNSSVHDYEKAGIVGNEVGTEINIVGNAVTGSGSITTNAQNGIQVGFGAKGYIFGNTVANHIAGNCATIQNCASGAANIVVFQANDAKVLLNNATKSQAGIFVFGDRAEIVGNTVVDTDVADGIVAVGNRNEVTGNRIFNSDRAGVLVQGNQNRVRSNFINEALVGIQQDGASSSGNNYSGNRYVNTTRQTTTSGGTTLERDADSSASGFSASRP